MSGMATTSKADPDVTLREMYEAAALERDRLARENERLRAQADEQAAALLDERIRGVHAAAERDALQRENEQLDRSDRAVRRVLLWAEVELRTGQGPGVVTPERLRLALDKGE